MKTVMQDLRYTVRQLIKMPGFTFTAVISLALGIGATTAVFSVVYAILMDPYPYTAADRMMHMRLIMPNGDINGYVGLTGSQWQEFRKSPVVEDSFLQGEANLTITGSDLPEDFLHRVTTAEHRRAREFATPIAQSNRGLADTVVGPLQRILTKIQRRIPCARDSCCSSWRSCSWQVSPPSTGPR